MNIFTSSLLEMKIKLIFTYIYPSLYLYIYGSSERNMFPVFLCLISPCDPRQQKYYSTRIWSDQYWRMERKGGPDELALQLHQRSYHPPHLFRDLYRPLMGPTVTSDREVRIIPKSVHQKRSSEVHIKSPTQRSTI